MKLKKLASLVLALALTVGLGTSSAFAADKNATASITINGAKAGQTFTAYQIFSATGANDNANITDGAIPSTNGYGDYEFAGTWQQGFFTSIGVQTTGVDAAVNYVSKLTTASEKQAFAKQLKDYIDNANKTPGTITSTVSSAATAAGSATIAGLKTGYYVVVPSAVEGVISLCMLNYSSPNVTLNAKLQDVPPIVKSVDSEGQKTADAEVGSKHTFYLNSQMPASLDNYTNYSLTFADTLTNLELDPTSMRVTVGNTELSPTDYSFTPAAGNKSFELVLTLKNETAGVNSIYTANAAVVVSYQAKVLNTATVKDPATNAVTLTYSNNQTTGDEKDSVTLTPVDVTINKVDNQGNAITSDIATFALYGPLKAKLAAKVPSGVASTIEKDSLIYYYYGQQDTAIAGDPTVNSTTFTGLGAGTYYLQEVKAPNGYNLLTAPEKIVISSAKDTQGNPVISYIVDNGTPSTSANHAFDISVTNNKGLLLPGTGSTGTQLFTVVGLLTLACAGAFLFFNRKRVFSK